MITIIKSCDRAAKEVLLASQLRPSFNDVIDDAGRLKSGPTVTKEQYLATHVCVCLACINGANSVSQIAHKHFHFIQLVPRPTARRLLIWMWQSRVVYGANRMKTFNRRRRRPNVNFHTRVLATPTLPPSFLGAGRLHVGWGRFKWDMSLWFPPCQPSVCPSYIFYGRSDVCSLRVWLDTGRGHHFRSLP